MAVYPQRGAVVGRKPTAVGSVASVVGADYKIAQVGTLQAKRTLTLAVNTTSSVFNRKGTVNLSTFSITAQSVNAVWNRKGTVNLTGIALTPFAAQGVFARYGVIDLETLEITTYPAEGVWVVGTPPVVEPPQTGGLPGAWLQRWHREEAEKDSEVQRQLVENENAIILSICMAIAEEEEHLWAA